MCLRAYGCLHATHSWLLITQLCRATQFLVVSRRPIVPVERAFLVQSVTVVHAVDIL